MKRHLFVDSWGWIALANAQDDAHETVRKLYHDEREAGFKIVTTDFVLDEVITFLFSKIVPQPAEKYVQGLIDSAREGHLQLEQISAGRFKSAWDLRLKYRDKPDISFTDLTSFVVMKELGIKRALTNDRHFTQVNLGFQTIP